MRIRKNFPGFLAASPRFVRGACTLLAALLLAAPARAAVDKDLRDAAQALDATMRRVLAADGITRNDGYLYGMDVAWLMLYAAGRGDEALYAKLRSEADRVIVMNPGDPYTQGFVLWRYKPHADFEVSGAGESVAMTRALLAGASRFNRPQDRQLAQQVLEGYRKLFFEQGLTWIVRRYFNFATRAYGDVSMLSSYAPDLLADTASLLPPADWPGPVERSYAALELAAADNGLIHPVIVPEINQTWLDLTLRAFAPNNIVPLEDSCMAAEGAVKGRPAIARKLLRFALDSDHTNFLGRLFGYFNVANGKPVGETLLTPTGYACLTRLALALGDHKAVKTLSPWLRRDMELVAGEPNVHPAPLFAAGPLLITAQALNALPAGAPPMAAAERPIVAGASRP